MVRAVMFAGTICMHMGGAEGGVEVQTLDFYFFCSQRSIESARIHL
jgi:hypothetical protein